jgi:hypothetical protein
MDIKEAKKEAPDLWAWNGPTDDEILEREMAIPVWDRPETKITGRRIMI